eukprot:m.125532 g.125532  ORF g.125532 m.125532 type:complete len:221 (-) comp17329_c0_seq1:382-1044(-)
MDDDELDGLDALLNDAAMLCTTSSKPSKSLVSLSEQNQNHPKTTTKSEHAKPKRPGADLDIDIDDILNDDLDSSYRPTFRTRDIVANIKYDATDDKKSNVSVSHPGTGRCNPVLLGGSSHEMGMASISGKKPCDRLKCIDCDFKVCWFNDHKWDDHCDYLFFRNGCTDPDKLKSKLVASSRSRAYACQCAWVTVTTLEPVANHSAVRKKWRCLPGTGKSY